MGTQGWPAIGARRGALGTRWAILRYPGLASLRYQGGVWIGRDVVMSRESPFPRGIVNMVFNFGNGCSNSDEAYVYIYMFWTPFNDGS